MCSQPSEVAPTSSTAPGPATTSAAKSVHIPASYITTQPSEGFSDASMGQLTWHTLISSPQTPTDALCAGVGACPPRVGTLALHRHTQAEIYHVIAGAGVVIVDGTEYDVSTGSTVFIPGDAEHCVRCEGEEELRWFYVFPTGAFGDVVYRFS